MLANGFRSEGMVSFPEAKIGGALNCTKGVFVNHTIDGKGKALSFERAQIEHGVYLKDGFLAEGEVRFYGSRIKANFECNGGRFNNPVFFDGGAGVAWNNALSLVGATIDGALWLGPRGGDPLSKAEFVGSVNLAGCHAHEIADHPSAWPHKGAGRATLAYIHLSGFTYDRMVGTGSYDAATRKRWLDRQPRSDLGGGFKPQPFEQLIKVYRAMGHEHSARDIAQFKARRWRRANFIKLWHGWRNKPCFWQAIFGQNSFASALDGLTWPFALLARAFSRSALSALDALEWFVVGFGAAYGYGYFRLAAFLLALWFFGGVFYGGAADQGGFAPSNPAIYLNKELQAKCGENWTQCSGAPPELPWLYPVVLLARRDAAGARPRPETRLAARIPPRPAGADGPANPHVEAGERSGPHLDPAAFDRNAAARRRRARWRGADADAVELAGAGPAPLHRFRDYQEGLIVKKTPSP